MIKINFDFAPDLLLYVYSAYSETSLLSSANKLIDWAGVQQISLIYLVEIFMVFGTYWPKHVAKIREESLSLFNISYKGSLYLERWHHIYSKKHENGYSVQLILIKTLQIVLHGGYFWNTIYNIYCPGQKNV